MRLSINLVNVYTKLVNVYWTFQSRLKTYLFHNSFPQQTPFRGLRTDTTDFMTGPFLLSISVFVFTFFITFSDSCSRLSWLLVSFLGARKHSVSYRIVSWCLYAMSRPINKTPMVLSCDNSFVVSNEQRSPVTSPRQPSLWSPHGIAQTIIFSSCFFFFFFFFLA